MKRVFTDGRFPGVEVVNYGDIQFFEVVEGKAVHEFTACEKESSEVSDSFAERRAKDYFDRLASQREAPVMMESENLPEGVVETDSVPVQIVSCLLAD